MNKYCNTNQSELRTEIGKIDKKTKISFKQKLYDNSFDSWINAKCSV